MPRSSKSLWKTVNLAKDINIYEMLNEMKLGGNIVDKTNLSESFATYFMKSSEEY